MRHQHRTHLDYVGCRRPTCVQPIAQCVRQRLRSPVDLQVPTQQRATVGGQTSVHRRAQGADGGDDADTEGEAQHDDPQPAHAATQFSAGQGQRQHQAATA